MPDMTCASCGAKLNADDIGATRKLINRGAEEFFCVPCLAKRFSVSEETLREKIVYWRSTGCLLFN
ncbi:MAG: hypothetical protein J5793_05145 [Clostridia bacterium]|nr:hypothetical protein [Clostridia bacterium]